MIPEGTYKCRGIEAALGYTSNDNEQVAVEIVLLEGGEEVEGRHMTWYGFFTEKSTDRTLEALRLFGWDGDDLSDLSGIDKNEPFVVVTHEEDQEGKVRARAAWINAGGGLMLKERMDEGSAKAFAERMKGHVLAQKQRKKGMPQSTTQQRTPAAASSNAGRQTATTNMRASMAAAQAPADDDIPF